ncbi:MAG TPA: sortase [Streptosporangiaceae bacterium]
MRRAVACLCLLAAAGVLLWSGYRVWDPFAGARQHTAQIALAKSWGSSSALPVPVASKPTAPALCVAPRQNVPVGQVFAIIQIPAFGPTWKFTVIQGTTLTQLASGPGHILGTALPSQAGDVGIAAHDVTAGNAFLHLDGLRTGDTIVITTKECVTTYRVYRQPYRVLYTDVGVLNPVGSKHTLTLVTCWPTNVLDFVKHRTIVQAEEIGSVRR